MDPVTGIVAGQAIQALTKSVTNETDSSTTEDSQDFSAQLSRLLSPDPANNINEEELYAALIEERLGASHGAEAAQAFADTFAAKKSEMARGDGYVPVEDAANAALQSLVAAGTVSADEAGAISDQAFKAAQLDDNLSALYDSRGHGDDPTIATMTMEAALSKARDALEALGVNVAGSTSDETSENVTEGDPDAITTSATSETDTDSNAEKIVPTGSSVDGQGRGFLFKPESERGELVILTPAILANQIDSLILKDLDGNELERGTSSGYANPGSGGEGEREHWRFSKPGASYGKDIVVEVTMKNGEVTRYEIPDPSKRYD